MGETYELRVARDCAAEPGVVFGAFFEMNADTAASWVTETERDLRVGGAWNLRFAPPGLAPFREERTLTEVDPPRRLAYTMRAIFGGAPDLTTTVAMTFETNGTGTRVTLAQQGFPTAEQRDDFTGGWTGVLDLLATRVANGRP